MIIGPVYKVLGRFVDLIIYINIYITQKLHLQHLSTKDDYRIHFHALLVRTDFLQCWVQFFLFLSKKYRPLVGVISESESMV